jgi:hypothetical protein
MPEYVPWRGMTLLLRAHRQWVAEGKKPVTDPVQFWNDVLNMDMDTMADLYYIDDVIRYLKNRGTL